MEERIPLDIGRTPNVARSPIPKIGIMILVLVIILACIGIYFITPKSTESTTKEPAANKPPNAEFTYTPTSPVITSAVHLIDRSTDADGSIVNHTWDFGDGNVSYEKSPSHRYPVVGTYNVNLTVKDDDGATDSNTDNIIVNTYYQYENSSTIESSSQQQNITSEEHSFDIYPNATQLTITVTYTIEQQHVIKLDSQVNVYLYYSTENESAAEDTNSGLDGSKTITLTGDQISVHGYGKWSVLIHHYSDVPTDNIASYTIVIRVDYQ